MLTSIPKYVYVHIYLAVYTNFCTKIFYTFHESSLLKPRKPPPTPTPQKKNKKNKKTF